MEAEEEALPTDGRKLIDQEGPLGLEEEEEEQEEEECITSGNRRGKTKTSRTATTVSRERGG